MPARERSGDKRGVGAFSYDLMVAQKWWGIYCNIFPEKYDSIINGKMQLGEDEDKGA